MPLQQTSGNVTADAYRGGVAVATKYIEQYFSTWLRTGTGASATIVTGLDASVNKALVWTKSRSAATDHKLIDTVRGATKALISDTTGAQTTDANGLTAFSSTGYTIGTDTNYNNSGATYVDLEFVATPKFFDVVTYTGTGANTTIAHNLGSVPGCIIVKRTDTTGNWRVYHNGLTSAAYGVQLNLTSAQASDTTLWNSTAPTTSVFSIGTNVDVNASGGTYVAYLFAHNAGGFGLMGTDNVISCGSYTGTGAAGNNISVGYEPQFVLVKRASGGSADWVMLDTLRGFSNNQNTGAVKQLLANTSGAESNGTGTGPWLYPNATGFTVDSTSFQYNASGSTYIYIAIRRGPMKVPTDPTKVFAPSARAGNGSVATSIALGSVTDLTIIKQRDGTNNWAWTDRLRSATYELSSATTTSETQFSNDVTGFDLMQGFSMNSGSNVNAIGSNYIDYLLARAPGFFDEVCYTATGSTSTQNHNLSVAPELIIHKQRNGASQWIVDFNFASTTCNEGYLNLTSAAGNYLYSAGTVVASQPTSTQIQFAAFTAGQTYVAYLFASCPGVSKVGSYTGNGTTQTINCGFAGGARLVLIKRTDSTGDWYVYDTARGMTTLTDPYLLMNSTAAETATLGSVTSVTTGFAVNASILAAINTNGASYIYLSIA